MSWCCGLGYRSGDGKCSKWLKQKGRPYREFRDLTKLLEEPEEKPGWLFRNDFQNPIKLTTRETDVTAITKSATHFMSMPQRPLPFPYQPPGGCRKMNTGPLLQGGLECLHPCVPAQTAKGSPASPAPPITS